MQTLISKLYSTFTIFCLILTANSYGEEIKETSWTLNEKLLGKNVKTPSKSPDHRISFGLGLKNIKDLTVKSSTGNFNFSSVDLKGFGVFYSKIFYQSSLTWEVYGETGYYTTYNQLDGDRGYADLSLVDVGTGISVGKQFLQDRSLQLNAFAGIGHSYYFQRGDANSVNADENLLEAQIGIGLQYGLQKSNEFPKSWTERTLFSLRASYFTDAFEKDLNLTGTRVLASIGVEL